LCAWILPPARGFVKYNIPFFDDAVYCAKALGLTLTTRDKGEPLVPMTGFPYHQIDAYVARLVSGGRKVAICEQVK
jgi:DNA mismatch repair protein MutS